MALARRTGLARRSGTTLLLDTRSSAAPPGEPLRVCRRLVGCRSRRQGDAVQLGAVARFGHGARTVALSRGGFPASIPVLDRRDDAPVNPVVTHLGEDAVDALQWLEPRMVLRVSTVSKIRNANEPGRGDDSAIIQVDSCGRRPSNSRSMSARWHSSVPGVMAAAAPAATPSRKGFDRREALSQRANHPPNEAVARTHSTRCLDRRAREPEGEVPGGEHGSLGAQRQRYDLGLAAVHHLAGQCLLIGRRSGPCGRAGPRARAGSV